MFEDLIKNVGFSLIAERSLEFCAYAVRVG